VPLVQVQQRVQRGVAHQHHVAAVGAVSGRACACMTAQGRAGQGRGIASAWGWARGHVRAACAVRTACASSCCAARSAAHTHSLAARSAWAGCRPRGTCGCAQTCRARPRRSRRARRRQTCARACVVVGAAAPAAAARVHACACVCVACKPFALGATHTARSTSTRCTLT
jgi:hypothetical protein